MIATAPEAPPWTADALCACGDYDPDDWFPEPGESEKASRALRICRDCPVRVQCLREALASGERFGIRGARTANQRTRILRRVRWLRETLMPPGRL